MGGHGGPPVPPKCMAAIDTACGAKKGKHGTCEFCFQLHKAAISKECTDDQLQSALYGFCFGGGGGGGGGMSIFSLISPLADLLNGTWYSTQASGECAPGKRPGDGSCWWRTVSNTRTVNSTCVNDNVIATVQATSPDCWKACPQPTNTSSLCWVTCLFATLSGNATEHKAPMSKAAILEPFDRSFATNDPSEGGCPDWHPPV